MPARQAPAPILTPTLDYEHALWAQGFRRVAGIDEAGRGALAGPVVAAAVIVPVGAALEGIWAEVRDSKQLTPPRRAELAHQVRAAALAWGVGVVSCADIDARGIVEASRQAMLAAVRDLAADALLIDWVRLPMLDLPQQSLIKADATIVSVAAASILAKSHRDALMVALAADFPTYGFDQHKGYGTQAHLEQIRRCGACPQHRQSFAPFRQQSLFEEEA